MTRAEIAEGRRLFRAWLDGKDDNDLDPAVNLQTWCALWFSHLLDAAEREQAYLSELADYGRTVARLRKENVKVIDEAQVAFGELERIDDLLEQIAPESKAETTSEWLEEALATKDAELAELAEKLKANQQERDAALMDKLIKLANESGLHGSAYVVDIAELNNLRDRARKGEL